MSYFLLNLQEFVRSIAGIKEAVSFEKMVLILQGLKFTAFFSAGFVVWYLYNTRGQRDLRKLLWWSVSIFWVLIFVKYGLFHFYKGYIPDRFIFYALPSPKAASLGWFIIPLVIFAGFLRYQSRIINWTTGKFLLALWAIFVAFSLSVSAIREGLYSIYERFTRIYWEYTGNLPLIENLGDFLHNYNVLNDQLANHTTTHPPGFTIILYLLRRFFSVDYLGLSILVALLGGLSVIPVYFFLKRYGDEVSIRRCLILFVFFPSFVLLGVTSMDVTFLLMVWVVLALFFSRNVSIISIFVGGIVAGFSLFQSFLFVLLAPLFFVLLYQEWQQRTDRRILYWRLTVAAAGFVLFFLALYMATGYSIIENYRVARNAQDNAVGSNFVSVGIYLLYFFMNLISFGIYLGIPNLVLFVRHFCLAFSKSKIAWLGVGTALFFSFIGIFQGETERIWLFITPLFIIPLMNLSRERSEKQFSAHLSLLFFQIILMQLLFYTYW